MNGGVLMKVAVGVDIGGTKVAVALINEKGEIVSRSQRPSQTESAEGLYQGVVKLIQEVLEENDLRIQDTYGIGVGLPGKVDVENGVAVFQNNIPWANFPVVERLKQTFGDIPVRIDNDVKVAAYAEYRLLHLKSSDMFGYVTVSTGIAATNIVNNTILRGEGFSGEIGFLKVPYFECLESLEGACSGVAIERTGRELYEDVALTTKDVFEKWRSGEEAANRIIEETAKGLASALHGMVCLLDPKVIVFGGSVSNYNPDFIELIKEELGLLLHHEQKHILENIKASTIKGDNGIIGAGLLVVE